LVVIFCCLTQPRFRSTFKRKSITRGGVVRLSRVEVEQERQSQTQESTAPSLTAALALNGALEWLVVDVGALQSCPQTVAAADDDLEQLMKSIITDVQSVLDRQNGD
jgi:hypothetical protein